VQQQSSLTLRLRSQFGSPQNRYFGPKDWIILFVVKMTEKRLLLILKLGTQVRQLLIGEAADVPGAEIKLDQPSLEKAPCEYRRLSTREDGELRISRSPRSGRP